MADIDGLPELKRRLAAITDTKDLLRQMSLLSVAEAKALVPRKTGNLARTIRVGSVTDEKAELLAGGEHGVGYAKFVERGTKAHEIVPRNAKALRFAATPGGRRLSGRPRTGASVVFAKRVRHPGTKAQPFLLPGAERAITKGGLKSRIIKEWNDAA